MIEYCCQEVVWEHDTGSSEHFVYDWSILTKYFEITDSQTVTEVEGAKFKLQE